MTRTQRLTLLATLALAALAALFPKWTFTSRFDTRGWLMESQVEDRLAVRALEGRRFAFADDAVPYTHDDPELTFYADGTPDYASGLILAFVVLLIGGAVTVALPMLTSGASQHGASRPTEVFPVDSSLGS